MFLFVDASFISRDYIQPFLPVVVLTYRLFSRFFFPPLTILLLSFSSSEGYLVMLLKCFAVSRIARNVHNYLHTVLLLLLLLLFAVSLSFSFVFFVSPALFFCYIFPIEEHHQKQANTTDK